MLCKLGYLVQCGGENRKASGTARTLRLRQDLALYAVAAIFGDFPPIL